ncbi:MULTISPECIES: response regulator transcription factor [unclassified Variovorax]|uniref:response regulator n=1 Tax=unclassified Variovorax TaxID=663243 RepID=UPI00076C57B5|nr:MULTISPECIES: response regulator transcription factor [unclassified Variovorax]KWT69770.1 Nitrate/nitrite response regulator protein [Variovorax sp. WDL1]PNG53380.1 Transcriptional activator protein ExaE [Variovorax sp. B2]PNG53953.1 Transcriptional activator protein ExaE [Variovorax sp. B4]VTV11422.1 Transcriptional activator protein ExaE [Variovorax sp. WDL1]
MNVLMIDDHVMFLQGMKNLLSVLVPELRVETAGEMSNAVKLVELAEFDLVLLDWHLADCTGEESIRRLRDAGCMARIVVLSGDTDATMIRNTVDLGAAGFIPKKYSSEMMVAALQQVLAGRIFLPLETLNAAPPPQVESAAAAGQDPRLAGLTPRQMDVYRAAARGLPNKLIARQLDIAESTVKAHLTAVYTALGVRNRTEAAYQASREGVRID